MRKNEIKLGILNFILFGEGNKGFWGGDKKYMKKWRNFLHFRKKKKLNDKLILIINIFLI